MAASARLVESALRLPRTGCASARSPTRPPHYGVLGVMGPQLSRLCSNKLSPDSSFASEHFPFGTSREVELGNVSGPREPHHLRRRARLGALRLQTELCAYVWETVVQPREPTSVYDRPATVPSLPSGSRRAIASGGTTSGLTTTPWQAGLGFAVDWTKERLPRARGPSEARAQQPRDRRLVLLTARTGRRPARASRRARLSRRVAAWDGVTSGAWGHSVDASLAMAWVDVSKACALVQKSSERGAASRSRSRSGAIRRLAHLRPLWDPGTREEFAA